MALTTSVHLLDSTSVKTWELSINRGRRKRRMALTLLTLTTSVHLLDSTCISCLRIFAAAFPLRSRFRRPSSSDQKQNIQIFYKLTIRGPKNGPRRRRNYPSTEERGRRMALTLLTLTTSVHLLDFTSVVRPHLLKN
ncbi:hypothetical protein YC2023_120856 [Brassica napus]